MRGERKSPPGNGGKSGNGGSGEKGPEDVGQRRQELRRGFEDPEFIRGKVLPTIGALKYLVSMGRLSEDEVLSSALDRLDPEEQRGYEASLTFLRDLFECGLLEHDVKVGAVIEALRKKTGFPGGGSSA